MSQTQFDAGETAGAILGLVVMVIAYAVFWLVKTFPQHKADKWGTIF